MPDTVAAVLEEESQIEESATPVEEDVATIKKRLAGTHSALTRTQQERDAAKAEAERLAAALKEKEMAEMTELEQAQARIKELETSNQALTAEALRAKYPLALEALDGDILPEPKLQALENRLKAAAAPVVEEAEEEPEPEILGNRPPRTQPSEKPLTGPERLAQLRQRVATEMPPEMWEAIRGAGRAQAPGN